MTCSKCNSDSAEESTKNEKDSSRDFVKNLINFISKSPTSFHATKNFSTILTEKGFLQLRENELWKIEVGGKYFVQRNDSSLIAFAVPSFDFRGFVIVASHTDSPAFKIKEFSELNANGVLRLNVEKYGSALLFPWFDRPLSIAGRVAVLNEELQKIKLHLVDFQREMLMIPSLAIHFDREANEGRKIDFQKEMLPILSSENGKSLKKIIAEDLKINEESILASDLFVYNFQKGFFWGSQKEFFSSPRLDDLECGYSTLCGFLDSIESLDKMENLPIFATFDNEEVGSATRQGADSSFLYDTLKRISILAQKSEEEHYICLANSFMLSADNAHALHPAFAEKSDIKNRPLLNAGPVAKINAAQKYTTDAISLAIFKTACKNANVPCQIFANNSNVAGGSTLGNISQSHVSVCSVDVGLAQWAMHSPLESAGSLDPKMLSDATASLFKMPLML